MKFCKKGLLTLFVFVSVLLCVTLPCEVRAAEDTVTGIDDLTKNIIMYYDDELSLSDYNSVIIINGGEPTSYKVGYGVPENTRDDAVISLSGSTLHATGVGTALIILENSEGTYEYTVTVKAAPISMFLLIGQSNMRGTGGDASQSVANTNGQVYSSNGYQSDLTVSNAVEFIPSALAGEKSKINTVGTTNYLSKNPVNMLTETGNGKIGPDSGLAYQWNKMTGDKVWTVNAAHGGTVISKWLKGKSEYEQAVAMFKAAQKVMANEIAAGHFELKNYGYFWLQGCSDDTKTALYYYNCFMSMHNDLKNDLAFDFDGDGLKEFFEFADIIMPRAGGEKRTGYRRGDYTDTMDKSHYQSFFDLEMRGQRVAQYYICNTPGNDIHLVSNASEAWVYMPDGTDGVSAYFNKYYPEGKIDYPVQVQQAEDWYTPVTPAAVHDSLHYNQIGFNEIGIDAARNAAYTHGRAQKPENVPTTVRFYDWTGYKEVPSVDPSAVEKPSTLVVPVVYPVYESKNVQFSISGNGVSYELYDLLSEVGTGDGATLTATVNNFEKTVTINGNSPELHTKEHTLVFVKETAATCTSNGYSSYIYCKDCNETIKQKKPTYPELGHKLTSYEKSSEATYFSDAKKTRRCTECSYKKTVDITGTKLILGKSSRVTASSTESSVKLRWNSVKNATGYKVYVYSKNSLKELGSTSSLSYSIKKLNTGTKYKFAVRAYIKKSGKTALSPNYQYAEVYTVPSAPSVVKATRTDSSVTLRWSSVKGATGYRVYVYNKGWKKVKSTNSTSFKITGLKSGKKYIYCVKPYIKFAGDTLWGDYKKVSFYTLPATPKVRTASTAKGRATVAWKDQSSESGYQVWYSSSEKGKYKKVGNYKADTVKIYRKGLKSGKKYYFKVRAYKKVGSDYMYSSYSAPVSVKIK